MSENELLLSHLELQNKYLELFDENEKLKSEFLKLVREYGALLETSVDMANTRIVESAVNFPPKLN